jgi:hypothetical protein
MRRIVVLAALTLFWGGGGQARADLISFTFEGTGTGNISGQPFTDSAFVIRGQYDTAEVVFVAPGLFHVPLSSVTIEIAAVGTGTFLNETSLFDNQQGPATLGFNDGFPAGLDLLDIRNPGFATYDLRSSFGPIFDPNPFPVFQFFDIPLDIGIISFVSYRDVTFTASAVPEPFTLTLLTTAQKCVRNVPAQGNPLKPSAPVETWEFDHLSRFFVTSTSRREACGTESSGQP